MFQKCYYYDDISERYDRISLSKMKELEKREPEEFLRRKKNLFLFNDNIIKMELVSNGDHQGFRLYGHERGNREFYYRGYHESNTHLVIKVALSQLKELSIDFFDKSVKIFISSSEIEKMVTCNNRRYFIDVYYKIDHTEPEEYAELFNHELYIEVSHKCKIEAKQAQDFCIERLPLFEYKYGEKFEIYNEVSDKWIEKYTNDFIQKFDKFGINGLLFYKCDNETFLNWYISKNKHWTAKYGDLYFTIIECTEEDNNYYKIIYGKETIIKDVYNDKKIVTIDEAKKNAEYFAFKLYNEEKRKI